MLDAALEQDADLEDETDTPAESSREMMVSPSIDFPRELLSGQSGVCIEGVFSSLRREGS